MEWAFAAAAALAVAKGMGSFFAQRAAARVQEKAARYAEVLAENRAIGLEQQATFQAAIAQRRAISERRAGRVIQSSALARAAATGADVSSPGITAVIGDIDREIELRALTSLYEGQEAEKGLRYQALVARKEGENIRYQGKVARKLGYAKANLALLGGASEAISPGIQSYEGFTAGSQTPQGTALSDPSLTPYQRSPAPLARSPSRYQLSSGYSTLYGKYGGYY